MLTEELISPKHNARAPKGITPMAEHTTRSTPALDDSTRIAYESMRATYERIMMAWISSATSLITFGFSIYKFFQLEAPVTGPRNRLIGPREFAFALVTIGLFSLLLATVEHNQNIGALSAQYG